MSLWGGFDSKNEKPESFPASVEPPNEKPTFYQKVVKIGAPGTTTQKGGISCVAVAQRCFLIACNNGELLRWIPDEDDLKTVEFTGRATSGKSIVRKIFIDPQGFHALLSMANGENWYYQCEVGKARLTSKLQGFIIECVAWNKNSTKSSTKDILIGARNGSVLEFFIDTKDKGVRVLYKLPRRAPVLAVLAEQTSGVSKTSTTESSLMASTSLITSSRCVVFIASNRYLHEFIGSKSMSSAFKNCSNPSYTAGALEDFERSIVFEAPRDTSNSQLILSKCSGQNPKIFWMSGAGIILFEVLLDVPLTQKAGAPLSCIKKPPIFIPYPKVDSVPPQLGVLLPEPPHSPLSLVVTEHHIICLFEGKMVALSRISHEKVFEQSIPTWKFGSVRQLLADSVAGSIFMFSDTLVNEVVSVSPGIDAWKLYLKKGDFSQALRHAKRENDRDEVVNAEAENFFSLGEYKEAAKKFSLSKFLSFEDVCLKFLHIGEDVALLQYLKLKLASFLPKASKKFSRSSGDGISSFSTTPQQVMLFVWIVELYIHRLNALESVINSNEKLSKRLRDPLTKNPSSSSSFVMNYWKDEEEDEEVERIEKKHHEELKELQEEFFELLREYKDIDEVQATLYALLHSHGRLDELLFYCEQRRDYDTLLSHHITLKNYRTVLEKLPTISEPSVRLKALYRFSPLLFLYEPEAFVNVCVSPEFSQIEPSKLIPAVLSARAVEPVKLYQKQAIRLLNHFVFGNETGGNEALNFDAKTFADTAAERASISGAAVSTQPAHSGRGYSSSSSSQLEGAFWDHEKSLWNCLFLLLIEAGNEEHLLELLGDLKPGRIKISPNFALALATAHEMPRARILLLWLFDLPEQAVEVALTHNFLDLAKMSASSGWQSGSHTGGSSAHEYRRRKLFLQICSHLAKRGENEKMIELVKASNGQVDIKDILPYMANCNMIADFKDEICETLSRQEDRIISKRAELSEHWGGVQNMKEETSLMMKKSLIIDLKQGERGSVCAICRGVLIEENFFIFWCGHGLHFRCLRRLNEQTKRLGFDQGDGGHLPPIADEDYEFLDEECVLCGSGIIESVFSDFIGKGVGADEIESWSVS